MVSGVTFKNPTAGKNARAKKKLVTSGLFFVFAILLMVIVAYGIGVFLKHRAAVERDALAVEIAQKRATITDEMRGPAVFIHKANALHKDLYTGQTTEGLLKGLEEAMVPRVVLKSIEHAYDARSGAQTLSITGDAEIFDALAAQIASWKESALFSAVHMGETTRDDAGRLVFAAKMDVMTPFAPVAYSQDDAADTMMPQEPQEPQEPPIDEEEVTTDAADVSSEEQSVTPTGDTTRQDATSDADVTVQ